jgi:hypothetical protein
MLGVRKDNPVPRMVVGLCKSVSRVKSQDALRFRLVAGGGAQKFPWETILS